MNDYYDPKLRARLAESARGLVKISYRGKHRDSLEHSIGLTNIHVEKGSMFANIHWGVDGIESPLSGDIATHAQHFEINWDNLNPTASGVYTLWQGKKKAVKARAVVKPNPYDSSKKSSVLVSGAKREDVVELFEMIRGGKLRPDVEQEEFKQIEGALAELKRLRAKVPQLESKLLNKDAVNVELNKRLGEVRKQLDAVRQTAAG